ncbi:3-dehydroquinate synthase [Thermoactinomyces sp. DSM 45892]|uniref:3-dehydroquinate synthase n=1 Tax=Thermoactinomyces sp. DSM 45892 TaxID=1882753 RepID=UPI0008999CA4|nr:3-dehydroquinate synthase [Thermoactinomyces sp. DSM 45892]SDY97817.1 3-dehydroquinate synthase [Thermoactinomyces sp. DSM 45892]
MRKLEISLPKQSYSILIGSGLLAKLPDLLEKHGFQKQDRLFLITDDQVAIHYLEPVRRSLSESGFSIDFAVVPHGEQSKSVATYESLIGKLIEAGCNRKSVILALGGGMVGDLAGFVAATYMRGVRFFQLPTTLLAHDSSVGGKVAINHTSGKNIMGAFYQPQGVIYDVDTLQTLSTRELQSGFAEVIKHGLIWDRSFVDWLFENKEELLERNPIYLTEAIERACSVKVAVVSQDETEQGIRAILNYGHTIGHAIEGTTSYSSYTHGEAISIGMVGSAWMSEQLHSSNQGLTKMTQELLTHFCLPTKLRTPLSEDELMDYLRRDKKHTSTGFTFIVSPICGQAQITQHVPEELVRQALRKIGAY